MQFPDPKTAAVIVTLEAAIAKANAEFNFEQECLLERQRTDLLLAALLRRLEVLEDTRKE